jgi:hypothetical protein
LLPDCLGDVAALVLFVFFCSKPKTRFLLCGVIWFGVFSVSGMFPRVSDDTYWEKAYAALSDEGAESVLVQHLSLASLRLSVAKPCLIQASANIVKIVKDGCAGFYLFCFVLVCFDEFL